MGPDSTGVISMEMKFLIPEVVYSKKQQHDLDVSNFNEIVMGYFRREAAAQYAKIVAKARSIPKI